ncbi:MAG: hypothetical protein ACD_7C00533G0005 [uncultured bacterium]|nr:MAG: hypothetical protein ACD_7C00533G0005 [uncultured bacterium]HBR79675.1 hypothetical protein [Candidatus Moranbacteria bacterium]
MGGFSADFYEKVLVEQKTSEAVSEERKLAFEKKYLSKLEQEYQQTIKTFSNDNRSKKEQTINESFQILGSRLMNIEGFEFGDRQKSILKLKLARYFQKNETCDTSTLLDAITETPKYLNTDKGSLYKLFEVHEQKTIEKIAELRKQRAEINGDEAYNPYESLFTTKSGNYILARLLNMPHLQEESGYMDHCVGTSDSYVNKMRRGEVEILSFRQAPKFNQATQKFEVDKPLITIEYNRQTNTIEQMKKKNDEYLKKDDSYFTDVVDALKQLRTTETDTGELRNFTKISASELENIEVEDYNILTEQGEISFRDFNPDGNIFILKTGKMEITPETSKEDAIKIIQIIEGIKCESEQLALGEDEITENTKIYIGQLSKEILQSNIEHIYTSFPEGKIEKGTLEIGGKTKEELKKEIKEKFKISSYAESMLDNPDFEKQLYENADAPREQWILKNQEQIDLVQLKVGDFGFTKNPTTDELYAKAKEFGLEICPAQVGPHLRLKYQESFKKEQPMNEYLIVAMKQITDSAGNSNIFHVGRNGVGLWLDRSWTKPGRRWGFGYEFVFRHRKLEA